MGKENLSVTLDQTPREKLLKHFKIAVVAFELHLPQSDVCAPADKLFEDRKQRFSSLRREELTDVEFIKDWMNVAPVPSSIALEIGMALGEMIASQEKSDSAPVLKQQ